MSCVAKRNIDISQMMNHNMLMSEIEERLGNYHAALAFHKKYVSYKDSIFSDENKQKPTA